MKPIRNLAVALGESTTEQMRAALAQAARVADVVELRVDMMDELDLPSLLADRACAVIVTCRAAREGGHWKGSESARLDVLRQAIDLGAELIDVELDCAHLFAEHGATRLIVSNHDFQGMPQLADVWRRLADAGADVVKVVGMATDALDTARVLDIFAAADRPTIAIAMGELGLASRVACLRHDTAFLTFCALGSAAGTAPGQISIGEMREVYHAEAIDGSTEFVGLIAERPTAERVAEINRELTDGTVCVPLPLGGLSVDAVKHAYAARGFVDFVVDGE